MKLSFRKLCVRYFNWHYSCVKNFSPGLCFVSFFFSSVCFYCVAGTVAC